MPELYVLVGLAIVAVPAVVVAMILRLRLKKLSATNERLISEKEVTAFELSNSSAKKTKLESENRGLVEDKERLEQRNQDLNRAKQDLGKAKLELEGVNEALTRTIEALSSDNRPGRARTNLELSLEDLGLPAVPSVPETLGNAVKDRRCTLFLGGGLSILAGFRSWRLFVAKVLEDQVASVLEEEELNYWKRVREVFLEGDTRLAAEVLRRKLGPELVKLIAEDYVREPPLDLPGAVRLLGEIPWRAVISTNWDRSERQLFPKVTKVLTPLSTDEYGEISRENEGLYVIKASGDPRSPDSIVFSPEEYREQLARNPAMTRGLASLFFRTTVVFVGCGLSAIEDFLDNSGIEKNPERPHFALVRSRSDLELQSERFWVKFNVVLLPFQPDPAHENLKKVLESLVEKVPKDERLTDQIRTFSTPRLSRVQLRNIGPYREMSLDFEPEWNLILGDNGTGKSSLLRAIAFGLCGAELGDQTAAQALLRAGQDRGQIEIFVGQDRYRTDLVRDRQRVLVHSLHFNPFQDGSWPVFAFPAIRGSGAESNGELPRKPHSNPVLDDVWAVATGGSDRRLVSLKEWIFEAYLAEALDRSEDGDMDAAQVLPEFKRLLQNAFGEIEIDIVEIDLALREPILKTADGSVPLSQISEGMRSVLAIVGTVCRRLSELGVTPGEWCEQRFLLMIDEIDAHLHPQWQKQIVDLLRNVFPEAQVLATSHSPLLVASCDEGEAMKLDRNGEELKLERFERSFRGMRADQILTDPAFSLETTLDPRTARWLDEYADLLAKSERGEEDERRIEELRGRLKNLPFQLPEETDAERAVALLFEAFTREKLPPGPEHAEGTRKLMREARLLVNRVLGR